MRRPLRRLGSESEDPLEGVANLFDLGIVFGLGFLLALMAYLGLPTLSERDAVTLIKNPGEPDMEILHREGARLERYRATEERSGGEGVRLGTAWRLKSGEVVYVPEAGEAPAGSGKPSIKTE